MSKNLIKPVLSMFISNNVMTVAKAIKNPATGSSLRTIPDWGNVVSTLVGLGGRFVRAGGCCAGHVFVEFIFTFPYVRGPAKHVQS